MSLPTYFIQVENEPDSIVFLRMEYAGTIEELVKEIKQLGYHVWHETHYKPVEHKDTIGEQEP